MYVYELLNILESVQDTAEICLSDMTEISGVELTIVMGEVVAIVKEDEGKY